jgi:UDP-GlcNAc:undecaprenyl-phosphate GlcNAc-1-phosphate transferase
MQSVASHVLNAFLMSVVLVLLLKRAAPALGLLDMPNERKLHEGGVPVVGGVAMFCAFVVATALLDAVEGHLAALVAGSAVLVATGVVDDRAELGPKIKLVLQSCAALIFIFGAGHAVRPVLPEGFGDAAVLAVPFTLVFIVGIVNAFNMMDGIDGLAGGAVGAALFWLAALAALHGRPELLPVLLLLAAVLGFLVFNLRHPWRREAGVFMGDAGSTMLGGAVAFFIVALSSGEAPVAGFPALLWICAVPAIDTVSLALRRMADGRSPFSPDRDHLHHIVLRRTGSPGRAAVLITAVCFGLGGVGFAGAAAGVSDGVMLLGLVPVLLLHTAFILSKRSTTAAAAPRRAPKLAIAEPGEAARERLP